MAVTSFIYLFFLKCSSSSSTIFLLHPFTSNFIEQQELRQGLFILFFFSQQYVATSQRDVAHAIPAGGCVCSCCFFFCPSFFALRVCPSLLGTSFIYSSTGLTDRRLRSPDRSHKRIVTLCVPSDSVIGSQLIKHHCTSFFFFSTSGTTLLLCTSVKIHKSVVVVYIESDLCQRFQQNNSRFT